MPSKRSKKVPEPVSRSTASIFLDKFEDEIVTSTPEPEKSQPKQEIYSKDDIANTAFPFNYIYQFQDFLNENITLAKGVQLAIMAFPIQLLYMHKEKLDLYERISEVFFNWVGIIFCLVLIIVRSKSEKITTPDFNYFYSIVIPTLLNVLHYDRDWFVVNLSLNYFILDILNPIFNVISSMMFYEFYKPENAKIPTIFFGQICLFQLFFTYIINYVNEGVSQKDELPKKTLKKSEIQLCCVLLTNLLFNPSLNKYLPITIFQKLFIALTITSVVLQLFVKILPEYITALLFGGIFSYLTIFQLNYVLKENAIHWLYQYIINDEERYWILKVWLTMASMTIPIVFYFVDSLSLNIRRKIWHLFIIIALTFTPSILYNQIEFTLISLLGMLIIFLIVELLRYNQITFFGRYLHAKLAKFQDSKDSQGPLNLSYIYLLIGVSIPIVYDYIVNDKVTIIRYSGLIAIGVGDTLASFIGQKFGTIKWKGSEKSLQGTVAFIFSVLLSFYIINLSKSPLYKPIDNWENVFVTVLLAGLLEGTAEINDNYLIPIFIPVSYEILNRCYS